MDRGIPTEAVLAEMRGSDPPVQYLVGTPKGRLSRLEQRLLAEPCRRPAQVSQSSSFLRRVNSTSSPRVPTASAKNARCAGGSSSAVEAAAGVAAMEVPREEMLMKLGGKIPRSHRMRLVDIEMDKDSSMFIYTLNRRKLRRVRATKALSAAHQPRRERSRAAVQDDIQLVAVEQAFKNLKGDLAIRPIFHQTSVGSKLISSLPSWPTACRSHCSDACMLCTGLPRAALSRNSPPFR